MKREVLVSILLKLEVDEELLDPGDTKSYLDENIQVLVEGDRVKFQLTNVSFGRAMKENQA